MRRFKPVARELIIPCVLLMLMMAAAAGIGAGIGIDGSRVFAPYLGTWASLTLLSVMVWFFVQVASLAPKRTDRPLQVVLEIFKERNKGGLWLSGLIFPLFLGAYTWSKCAIPLTVGYGWERLWADTDVFLLGNDAWKIAHQWIPPAMAPLWTFFYAVVWGVALAIIGPLVASFATAHFTARFFTAMMFTWLLGGFLLAYLIPAAGPVFAHLADPAFVQRFAPLRSELIGLLGRDDIVITSQRYLEAGYGARQAVKGGGISAMPSMHIATATIFICASWRTKWLLLAVPFWLLTFVGSVYLGYHYAVDAPVAAAVAIPGWMLARRIHKPASRSAKSAIPMPAALSAA